MAFQAGHNATVWMSGANLTPAFTSVEFSIDIDTAETTTLAQSNGKTYIPTLYSASLSLSGLYDPSYDASIETLLDAGNVVTYCPAGGYTVGDLARFMTATGTNYTPSSDVGDAVQTSLEFQSDAPVLFGQVLHPLSEDTNTTTGSTKDDTASTSTGVSFAVHVTVIDGGTWVIKMQDASASNFSDGADVTGMATTSLATIGAQIVQSSSATATLRRYVRYVATRTGGSAGDGITFAMAYSRSVSLYT